MAEKKDTLARPGPFNLAEAARGGGNAAQERAESFVRRIAAGPKKDQGARRPRRKAGR